MPKTLYIKVAVGSEDEQVLALDFEDEADPTPEKIVAKFNVALKANGLVGEEFDDIDFNIGITTMGNANLKGASRGDDDSGSALYSALHKRDPDKFPESIFSIANGRLHFSPPRANVGLHKVQRALIFPAEFIAAPLSKVLDSVAKQAFIEAHTQLVSDQKKKWFGSLRRTRIDPDTTPLEDIVRHVKFSSGENRSKKVFKQLGWMDKKGELTDKAPFVIRHLYGNVTYKKADPELVRQKFVDQHEWLMSKEKRDFYGFFSKMLKTTIRKDTSLEEIVSHVKESGLIDNRSKQVFKQLGWMSKDGKITQGAPDVVRDLFNKDTPANKPPVPKAR